MFSRRETVTYQQISQSNPSSVNNEIYKRGGQTSMSEVSYPNSEGYTYKGFSASIDQERDHQTLGLDSLMVNKCSSMTSTNTIQVNCLSSVCL